MNSDLIRRINAFEQWCYRRILKIKWTDRIPNAEVMQRMKVPEMCLYKGIQKQKMTFAGHILRGSSGENELLLLEGKMDAHMAQGRPRRMWIDDIKNWTKLDTYEKIKRNAADRLKWRTYTTTCQLSTTEDDS